MTEPDAVRIPRLSTSHPVSMQRQLSPEMDRLRAAYERVKEFPEGQRNGWANMLELRQAVEKYLERWG